ncbi:glycoside hydrolase family 16 protein [uncultured Erythrobacter sp.]|uniref:glycoside hydrolase family 16 protein n=1 Tax=uncultured Erythrobacter sp. TaxID=263913 RepID=UPI00263903B6|nr:glycoside hydrolase family 16 protein [uncultured Erythrobacter sp.]
MHILAKFGLAAMALMLSGCFASAGEPEEVVVAPVDGADWQLVWSDEFDGSELDRSKWIPEESCWGGGNNERQCYTDRPENIAIEDGFLVLKAQRETFTGPARPPEIAEDPNPQITQEYTSGKVRTRGLHAWQYGRIEVRAKVPAGQGMWPAVWMMPADDHYGTWPLSGEIDILETVNIGADCDECEGDLGENRTVSALHFGDFAPNNAYVSQKTPLPSLALPSDEYHVYSVEWGEGLIRFLVDDRVHFTVTRDDWFTSSPLAMDNPNAPFDQPFYVMANLAVGGKWPEESNELGLADSSTPNQLSIDWIRVYQCESDPETGRACME